MTNFIYPSYLSAILGKPAYIADCYTADAERWKARLGPMFAGEPEEHFKLMYCAQVSHEAKPYGASVSFTMADLLADTVFDCDNYVMFAWRLFNILVPTPTTHVAAIGWNKAFLGNHAQLMAKSPDGYNLLTDPTIGMHQIGSGFDLNWIAGGKAIPDDYRTLVFSRQGEYAPVDLGAVTIQTAFREGKQRPSNVLYFLLDVECFGPNQAMNAGWPTAGGAQWL